MKKIFLLTMVVLILAGCGAQGQESAAGDDSGITVRHKVEIPPAYAGKTNPSPADEASIEQGAVLYATNCASCHGESGMGDGPAAAALNPPPAPIAQSSQAVGDDYLFWRISEGGTPFDTSMPPWKTLDETSRWDLINYIRTLGARKAAP